MCTTAHGEKLFPPDAAWMIDGSVNAVTPPAGLVDSPPLPSPSTSDPAANERSSQPGTSQDQGGVCVCVEVAPYGIAVHSHMLHIHTYAQE